MAEIHPGERQRNGDPAVTAQDRGRGMSELDRDGVRVHYEVHGEGPPILLSHGYTASASMWQPQIGPLTRSGFQVITWDQRGHGRSDYPHDPADYGEELAVGDMAAVLDAAGVRRAVIAGLSLGGYLSLAFHLRHPERTAALVLLDTGPGFKRDEARAAWNDQALQMAAEFEARGLDALVDRAEVDRDHRDAGGLVGAGRGLMVQRDARVIESLPEIRVPTLVVVGEHDTPFLNASAYMEQKIPGASRVVVPGAGHAANLDRPEEVNDALIDFLERTRSEGSWA